MQKSKNMPIAFLGLLGFCMIFNGLFVLGQSTLDASTQGGWRRTTLGWEHAESLPIHQNAAPDSNRLVFPALAIPLDTIDRVHRLTLPLAISGFMACMGPWLLIRWPTSDSKSAPQKNA